MLFFLILFLSLSQVHVLDHETAAFPSHSQWLQRQTRRPDGFWHHQWTRECVQKSHFLTRGRFQEFIFAYNGEAISKLVRQELAGKEQIVSDPCLRQRHKLSGQCKVLKLYNLYLNRIRRLLAPCSSCRGEDPRALIWEGEKPGPS